MRGEFAGACEHYEQAIAVVTEVGAIEDVIRMRSRQAQLYWLLGDEQASTAAMAEARAVRGTGRVVVCAGRAGPGRRRNWPAGAATPSRHTGNSASR